MATKRIARADVVLAWLQDGHDGATVADVRQAFDWNDQQARMALDGLYARRLVGRQLGLLKGLPAHYYVAQQPEPLELTVPATESIAWPRPPKVRSSRRQVGSAAKPRRGTQGPSSTPAAGPACKIPDCPEPVDRDQLCHSHLILWERLTAPIRR